MIAVVTGASGFIGRHLVGRLQREGHVVRCLTRVGGGEPPAGVQRVRVDMRDASSLGTSPVFDDADVVFHLSAATRARSSDAFRIANVEPTRNILEALAQRALTPRFVFVSSQAAAGPAGSVQRAVTEDDPPRPVEEYGRSKLEAERVVAQFRDRVPCVIVRPCSVFGPHDRDFLPMFRMTQQGVLVYPGTKHHWLSLLHIDDVVEGLLAAARMARSPVYFLAPEAPIQWRTLGEVIEGVAGRSALHVGVPGALVRGAAHIGDLASAFMLETPLLNTNKAELSRYPYWVCSAERAARELEWRPTRSLPDGVRDTYLWYQRSGWLRGRSRGDAAVA